MPFHQNIGAILDEHFIEGEGEKKKKNEQMNENATKEEGCL